MSEIAAHTLLSKAPRARWGDTLFKMYESWHERVWEPVTSFNFEASQVSVCIFCFKPVDFVQVSQRKWRWSFAYDSILLWQKGLQPLDCRGNQSLTYNGSQIANHIVTNGSQTGRADNMKLQRFWSATLSKRRSLAVWKLLLDYLRQDPFGYFLNGGGVSFLVSSLSFVRFFFTSSGHFALGRGHHWVV